MDKTFVLKGEVRANTGSKQAAKVRKAGQIPAVVYGHKQEPTAISLDGHNFLEGLHHGHRLINVQIGRKKETTLIKAVQYDYLGRDIIHVDLMRVDVTETIKIKVPIELKGTAHGTTEGGIIEEHVDSLEVECLVSAIPEKIVVFVKDVSVGDAVHADAIELPAGVKLAGSPETLVVTCHLVAAAKTAEEAEEEEAIAPEVIGEGEQVEGAEGVEEAEEKK